MADVGPVSILFDAIALGLGGSVQPVLSTIAGQDPITAKPTLDLVTLDATLEEVHSYTAEVTDHPVESGADITDHVRPKPIEIRLRGIVSNSPLGGVLATLQSNAANAAAALGLSTLVGNTPLLGSALAQADISKQAFETLTKLSQAGSPCIVHTKYRDYTSMIMSSLEVTRDPKTGDALSFSAQFRQITTVESATATIASPQFAQESSSLGAQGTSTSGDKPMTEALDVKLFPGFAESISAIEKANGAPNPFSGNIP